MLINSYSFAITGGDPDDPPGSPDAMDDEFDGGSLDAKWTWQQELTGGQQATAVVAGDELVLSSGLGMAGAVVQAIEQSFTGTAIFRCKLTAFAPDNFNIVGLGVKDSGTGRIFIGGFHHNGAGQRLASFYFNSDTSYGSTASDTPDPDYGNPCYLEIEIDATNIYFRRSDNGDGVSFTLVSSFPLASFIGTPDRIQLQVVLFGGGASPPAITVEWFRRFA